MTFFLNLKTVVNFNLSCLTKKKLHENTEIMVLVSFTTYFKHSLKGVEIGLIISLVSFNVVLVKCNPSVLLSDFCRSTEELQYFEIRNEILFSIFHDLNFIRLSFYTRSSQFSSI